nr:uncharacterized protein LOC113818764 [Penaeus vannamei]
MIEVQTLDKNKQEVCLSPISMPLRFGCDPEHDPDTDFKKMNALVTPTALKEDAVRLWKILNTNTTDTRYIATKIHNALWQRPTRNVNIHVIYLYPFAVAGSAFCVDAPTLLGNETCDKKNYLILITSSTTSWKLDCPGVAQAPEGTPQCRHYLLYVLYLGLDSGPTSFYWKPNAVATRLKVINLSAEAKFHHETDVWAKDTATWMDVNLGRDPDGGPCRVYSKRLHLSYQCSETFNKSHFLPFLGIDKDHNRRPSYFAFNCSGIPEVVSEDVPHKTELRSPLEIVSHKTEPWFPFAIVAAVVVVVIGVVLVVITAVWVVVKVRKSRSSSQAAIPADDLHDPGRDDRESEHEYWDIDSVVLRAQLEERRATRTRHDGGTTSLHRCKSENSLHGAIRNGVSYECINPLYGAIHPGVRCKSENSLYGAIHPGVRPRGRNRVGRKTMPLMHDRESEHEYCYIDSPVMRAQPEERRATRTRHDGGTTSLRRCKSENSLYGAIHPGMRPGGGVEWGGGNDASDARIFSLNSCKRSCLAHDLHLHSYKSGNTAVLAHAQHCF